MGTTPGVGVGVGTGVEKSGDPQATTKNSNPTKKPRYIIFVFMTISPFTSVYSDILLSKHFYMFNSTCLCLRSQSYS
jgi:hypothetical protein